MCRFLVLSLLLFGTASSSSSTRILQQQPQPQQETIITVASTCIQDFQEIYDIESELSDTSVNRTYVICPNKLYAVGYLDRTFQNLRPNQVGGPPLPLRSNMKIQCGDDGSRANLCYITGGHLQVDGTAIRGLFENDDGDDHVMDNVVLEGFVFIDAQQYSFWAMKRGSVLFKNCEWRVSGLIL